MSLLERAILNSGMCRKPQAKLEKACIRLRSLRRMFSEVKPEKHQTTLNRKPENPMLFLTKAKNRERNWIETAIVIKAKKRKFRSTKPKNRSTTLAETAKPKIPMHPSCNDFLCAKPFANESVTLLLRKLGHLFK